MMVRRKTLLGVVHTTATAVSMKLTSAKLRQMHKARGWSDIGYPEWIDRSGKLLIGRGTNKVGAHVRGYNSISWGIALEGGYKTNNFTKAQMKTLERRLKEITKLYPKIKFCGHRDLSPDLDGDGIIEPHEYTKQCPRFDVIPWVKKLGLPGADIKGTWDTYTKEGPDKRIVWLQKLLRRRGYSIGPLDGILGPKTKKALKDFQSKNGLKPTGSFNKSTIELLKLPKQISKPKEKINVKFTPPKNKLKEDIQPIKKPHWFTLSIESIFDYFSKKGK